MPQPPWEWNHAADEPPPLPDLTGRPPLEAAAARAARRIILAFADADATVPDGRLRKGQAALVAIYAIALIGSAANWKPTRGILGEIAALCGEDPAGAAIIQKILAEEFVPSHMHRGVLWNTPRISRDATWNRKRKEPTGGKSENEERNQQHQRLCPEEG